MKRGLAFAAASLLCVAAGFAQEDASLTPKSLAAALAARPAGPDADRLGDRIRTLFGGRDILLRGAPARVDELTVAFAIEAPDLPASSPAPRAVADHGMFSLPLVRVGTTPVYAGVANLTHGAAFTWHYEAAGARLGGGQLEVYETHPDARERPGVPKGKLTQMPPWHSTIFAGTTRDWWVYVPAQYTPSTPAAVMVFQDGNTARQYVVPVLDNLIAQGDIPVMAAIFIEPGGIKAPRDHRSVEYDTLSDHYARFLLEEILPEVEKTVRLRRDGAGRAIAGQSSGAIAAFTAAWERPAEFARVLSGIGSFTNIQGGSTMREGGHNYAALVRRVPRKPIRIFMQDGANDLDNQFGSWWLANQTLARSFAFAGYDYRFEQGQGFHNNNHIRAILPDALRWLWRD